eukprot:139911-Chlamydomonas_euryale.AAC.1
MGVEVKWEGRRAKEGGDRGASVAHINDSRHHKDLCLPEACSSAICRPCGRPSAKPKGPRSFSSSATEAAGKTMSSMLLCALASSVHLCVWYYNSGHPRLHGTA